MAKKIRESIPGGELKEEQLTKERKEAEVIPKMVECDSGFVVKPEVLELIMQLKECTPNPEQG